jgi:hypothetical protein
MDNRNDNKFNEMRIYPRLPSAPDDRSHDNARRNFVYFVVNEKQEKMNSTLRSMEKSAKKFRKATKSLGLISSTCGSLAVASTGASFAAALSGVGIVASVPLSILSASLGLISVVTTSVNEKLHSMLQKKEDLLHIASSYKNEMEHEIGIALSDEKIETEEYSKIIYIYQDFVDKYQTERGSDKFKSWARESLKKSKRP